MSFIQFPPMVSHRERVKYIISRILALRQPTGLLQTYTVLLVLTGVWVVVVCVCVCVFILFFFKSFFWMWTIFFFKSLLNLLQYCFYVLAFWPEGMWDLSFESTPPALESEIGTTGPPGKSLRVCLCAWMLSCFSCVCPFLILWTVAHQASVSMEFSRQE